MVRGRADAGPDAWFAVQPVLAACLRSSAQAFFRRDPMSLLLSDDDTAILRDLLADYLPALRREVARTEQHDLRHLMVQRQELVERVLEQLGQPAG